jgi:predicted O-methyltransferase YrrM
MSPRTTGLPAHLQAYLHEATLREAPILRRLREETARMPMAQMQLAPEQGQLLGLFVEMLGARRCLEVGTFTGYSALSVALALPSDGALLACDVNEEWTTIARRYWREAGVAHKIELRLRPALATLDELLDAGRASSFDFAFVDADKENNPAYYERCLRLLRPGGMIAFDNALWEGAVADPNDRSASTRAIRALNLAVRDDPAVTMSLIPIGDGLLVARKRGA